MFFPPELLLNVFAHAHNDDATLAALCLCNSTFLELLYVRLGTSLLKHSLQTISLALGALNLPSFFLGSPSTLSTP